MIGPFQVIESDDEARCAALNMRLRAAEITMQITKRSKFIKVRESGHAMARAIRALPLNSES